MKFEEELINAKDIKYSIVRPTAFFKSVSGQFGSMHNRLFIKLSIYLYHFLFLITIIKFNRTTPARLAFCYVWRWRNIKVINFNHSFSSINCFYRIYYILWLLERCNPIAETDLAEFMLNCVEDTSKWNQILNIGGPDDGMTMKQQGEMIFKVI